MESIPKEINIYGVYIPPMLLAGAIGVLLAYIVLTIMIRYKLTKYFYHVMLVFVCLAVIFTVIADKVISLL